MPKPKQVRYLILPVALLALLLVAMTTGSVWHHHTASPSQLVRFVISAISRSTVLSQPIRPRLLRESPLRLSFELLGWRRILRSGAYPPEPLLFRKVPLFNLVPIEARQFTFNFWLLRVEDYACRTCAICNCGIGGVLRRGQRRDSGFRASPSGRARSGENHA